MTVMTRVARAVDAPAVLALWREADAEPGHTDNVGSDAYNQALSERRTASVKDYVVKKGVAGTRVSGQGFGESKPIADNKTAEGRAKNRRVEIKVN